MDPRTSLFETGLELGAGATGIVLEARLARACAGFPAGQELAVKFLRPELRDDPRAVAAFRTEARLSATVRHPGIVHGFAGGEDGRGPWYAMLRVPGPTLREVLDARGPLPEDAWRAAAARLAGALGALHAAGYLHGDLKPENARLDAGDLPVLLDLGFAADAASAPDPPEDRRPGSLPYLSPEAARGERPDARSELFSLGILLYLLATGAHPFVPAGATDSAEVLRALREARYVPPSRLVPALSPFLDHLLEECLAVEPDRRPDAFELARRLELGEESPWWRARLAAGPGAAPRAGRGEAWIPFVGRARELAELERVWRETERGGGGLVWLWGEVGSGKSRLVSEFVSRMRRAETPPLFLSCRCPEYEEERPAEPVLQLLQQFLALPRGRAAGEREHAELARLVPPAETRTLVEALDPASERAAASPVPNALARWLAALGRRAPLIVFLDDLNWAGRGTLEVLERLVEEGLAGGRLLLVFGMREDLARRLPRRLDRLRRRVTGARNELDLELHPVDRQAVRELVEQTFEPGAPRLSLARTLWEKSHGNPGFLVEILRGMVARGDAVPDEAEGGRWRLRIEPERIPWPHSLKDAIHASYRQLPAGDRRWLGRCAVAGGRIQRELLLRAWPDESPGELEDTLARLVSSGWLVRAGDRLRFAWPALRQTVYRSVRTDQRRRMHGAVADALEPAPGGAISFSDAFQRAFHLRAAGRSAELLAWIEALLPRLVERGQPQRLTLLGQWGLEAIEALPPDPKRERQAIALLEAAADATDRLGRRQHQRTFLDRLSELDLDPDRDPEAAGRIYLLHARYAIGVGQYGPARAMLNNAVAWFERAENPALSSDALRRLAAVQAHVGELDEARVLTRRARDEAPTDLLRARAEIGLGVIDVLTDALESALRQADRAIRILSRSEGPLEDGTRSAAHLLRAWAYRAGGRPRRALASAQRALRLARRAGEGRLETEAMARLGGHLLDVDRPAEAEERLREALRMATEIEDRRSEAIAALFLGILLSEADRPEADRWLQRATHIAVETSLTRIEAVALAVRARRLRREGDARAALAKTERAMELLERTGAEMLDRAVIVGSHAVVLHELGRTDEAGQLVRELRRVLRRENERIASPLLRRRHRLATTRLLQAVLAPQGPVYPRVRLEHFEPTAAGGGAGAAG